MVNGKPGSQNGDPADLELSGDLRQSYLKISTADIAAALGKIGQTFRQDVQLMVVAWFTDGTWTKEPGVLTVKVGHTANREAAVRSALNGLSRPVSEGTSYVLLGQSTGPGSTVPNTQQPPRWIAVPETNHIESFIAYIKDSAEQIALGNFTDKVTVGGTTGQIALGFAGLDVAGDMRDLSADLANWEWSWAHGAQTTLDLIGFLPVIGSIKYGDEVALLVKRYAKQGNEIVEAGGEVVRGGNRRIDGMFNLLLKEFPNGHAVFKHVGQSDAQLKAMLATDSAASAFTDILSAQHSIDATLARYSKEISDWVSDSTQIQRKVLEMDMGNFIGRRVTDASPDTIRDVTKVRVVLTKNEQGGWNLLTAYPIE